MNALRVPSLSPVTVADAGDAVSWGWLLAACGLAFGLKLAGYLLPRSVLERPAALHVAAMVTVGLLAALTVMNTFTSGRELTVDARIAALVVAVVALRMRAPFLLVVVLGAASVAVVRALGWG
ncbi:AzlD domain-containing protein [Kytococcus sedentarius]|uniref:AzlD domain-containing protein n=1 Tax=Kytococcus sedentarius TaxID=1276 RepID=UPI0035BC6855